MLDLIHWVILILAIGGFFVDPLLGLVGIVAMLAFGGVKIAIRTRSGFYDS
jgi:hypothetical protein